MKKTTLVKLAVGFAFALLMLIGGWQVLVSAQDADKESYEEFSHGRTIEGVWNNQITVRNCQTGAPIVSFAGLLTFHKGGTLSETAAGSSPALRSLGHGIWQRRGWRRYEGKFTLLRFNPDGTFAGTQVTIQNIQLNHNGDSFTDTAAIQIFNAAGNQIAAGCAAALGTRFE